MNQHSSIGVALWTELPEKLFNEFQF